MKKQRGQNPSGILRASDGQVELAGSETRKKTSAGTTCIRGLYEPAERKDVGHYIFFASL